MLDRTLHYKICMIIVNQPTSLQDTANVAFLAIPSVDNVTNDFSSGVGAAGYPRTPAQVTSFTSVVFSLGSLATGQLLLRHHMIRHQNSAEEVVSPRSPQYPGCMRRLTFYKDKYLRSCHGTHHSLGTLSILYSLPYPLFLWV